MPACWPRCTRRGSRCSALRPAGARHGRRGRRRVVEWSEGTFVAAIQAATLGLDSQPWPTGPRHRPAGDQPVAPRDRRPAHRRARARGQALVPDVALIHVDGIDEQGNAHVEGDLVLDGLLARAARRVVVTYEREVDADPARAAISHLWLDDAVAAPGGATPTACPPALRRSTPRRWRRRDRRPPHRDARGGARRAPSASRLRADDPRDRRRRPRRASPRVRAARALGRAHRPRRRPARLADRRLHAAPPRPARRRGRADPARRRRPDEPLRDRRQAGPAEGRRSSGRAASRQQRHAVAALVPARPRTRGRTLVERVDVVCGPAPTAATGPRTLLSPAGCFDLEDGRWRARWLTPDGDELVSGVPAFPIEVPDGTPVREVAERGDARRPRGRRPRRSAPRRVRRVAASLTTVVSIQHKLPRLGGTNGPCKRGFGRACVDSTQALCARRRRRPSRPSRGRRGCAPRRARRPRPDARPRGRVTWSVSSAIIRTPVAPTGWPHDWSPPETLTGMSPP